MKIVLHEIPIREVYEGYKDDAEEGVYGYGGKLNIRPKYQREFIYKDPQRDAVLNTIRKNFPLNVMYWVKNPDGTFELLDGQQRTISFCQYISGTYSINFQYFHNLEKSEQEQILNYPLMVYHCEGSDREKLDWFKTINIAGERLTDQELRNAIYSGEWLTDAKRHFSKQNCVAYNLAKDYMRGSPIRQDYLETTIGWISDEHIEGYMSEHQHKPSASDLWLYFQNVINWTRVVFPHYRREMKGVSFGRLYNQYKSREIDPAATEVMIASLMRDDEVTRKSGIYEYVFTSDERALNIRSFSENQKREAYENQEGTCIMCGEQFAIGEMEADHITPWSDGGKTIVGNCQMLCKKCNRIKSGR